METLSSNLRRFAARLKANSWYSEILIEVAQEWNDWTDCPPTQAAHSHNRRDLMAKRLKTEERFGAVIRALAVPIVLDETAQDF